MAKYLSWCILSLICVAGIVCLLKYHIILQWGSFHNLSLLKIFTLNWDWSDVILGGQYFGLFRSRDSDCIMSFDQHYYVISSALCS